MRVAVYGGSFDPPHVGHAMVAAWARWAGLCDEVWLVPVGDHPFGKASSDFEVRVGLAEALARDVGSFVRVSRVEGERPGPHYTIDTLRRLAASHPGATFRLLMGADLWPSRSAWRSWDAIEAEFCPIVVGRGDVASPQGWPAFSDVSSSAMRLWRAQGRSLDGWLTRSVADAWLPEGAP